MLPNLPRCRMRRHITHCLVLSTSEAAATALVRGVRTARGLVARCPICAGWHTVPDTGALRCPDAALAVDIFVLQPEDSGTAPAAVPGVAA